MSATNAPLRALLPFLPVVLAFGCGAGASAKPWVVTPAPAPVATVAKPAAVDPAVQAARVKRMREWEAPAMKTFHVEMPEGILALDVEGTAAPKVECAQQKSGSPLCSFTVELGKDAEGDAHSITCSAHWGDLALPFGIMVHESLGKFALEETPRVAVSWNGGTEGGLVATFYAAAGLSSEQTYLVANAKLAVRYTPGHTLFCGDIMGGGEKTFGRVVQKVFETAKVKGQNDRVVSQIAYRSRRGDAVTGFTYGHIRKDDDGFVEALTHTSLEADDKNWDLRDFTNWVSRDADGSVSMHRKGYFEGVKAVAIVTAKPSEGGRLRVKIDRDGKTDAVELTPLAPLGTELWEAPSLLRVGAGTLPSHRYAFPAIADDGEPTLRYSELSRIKDGVVEERIATHGAKSKTTETSQRNELTLDAQGSVSKQVSSDSVIERLYLFGGPPALKAATKPPAAKVPPSKKK
ncbi:MAG: hypothetical protein HOO96_28280 [Polyangiaceae bacterium]|nr:hypothetical protein [Polyangiaceae bacterium]